MTVFNVEREEHAARIARKEIGQRLENIPLDVLEIEQLEEDGEDSEESEEEAETSDPSDEGSLPEESKPASDEDDVLPEFEELIDE